MSTDATRSPDVYGGTIDRFEQNIAAVDVSAAAASIAISLKRIADALDQLEMDLRNNG